MLRAARARPAASGLLEALKAQSLEPSLVELSLAVATWQEALGLLPGGDLMAYSGAMTACLPRWPCVLEIQEQMMARRRGLDLDRPLQVAQHLGSTFDFRALSGWRAT